MKALLINPTQPASDAISQALVDSTVDLLQSEGTDSIVDEIKKNN